MAADKTLKHLHTALVDTITGYEEAARDAELAEPKRLLADMLELRRTHEDAVRRALVDKGEEPDADGSLMGTVHKLVISVRSATTGLDAKALAAFADGEDSVLDAYAEAEKAQAGDPRIAEMLATQKAAVQACVAEMRRVAARG